MVNFPAAKHWLGGKNDPLLDSHPHRDISGAGPIIRCHGRGVKEVQFHFRRGFAHSVTCTAADWFAHGDAIRAAHPVRRVELTTWPGETPGWPHQPLPDLPDGFTTRHPVRYDAWPGVDFELPPPPRLFVNRGTFENPVWEPVPTGATL
jgi:hypothetical protein